MTSPAKRKVPVTLDADLVAAVEADDSTTLSAAVNSALRAEFTRRKRQQALADLLDQRPPSGAGWTHLKTRRRSRGTCTCWAVRPKGPVNSGPADATGARRRSGECAP
jgi:hypothetical protein